jgi:predicted nucleotidyltransferase
MIDESTIQKATDILRQTAQPRKIILFGSYSRGEQTDESDVDLLVVEVSVPDIVAEMVRLRRALRSLRIPVDVIVIDEGSYQEWSSTPGNILFEAASEGRMLYEAA